LFARNGLSWQERKEPCLDPWWADSLQYIKEKLHFTMGIFAGILEYRTRYRQKKRRGVGKNLDQLRLFRWLIFKKNLFENIFK
jgi:hypothetical protein